MQRVAAELLAVLDSHPEVDVTEVVLHSSWRATYVRTVPFLGRALWTIRRGAARREFDVVLFSSMVTASLLMPVVRKLLNDQGIPAVAIVHGQDVTWQLGVYQNLVRGAMESLDVVVPVSRATASVCLERGADDRKFRVIPNGVNLNGFAKPLALPGILGMPKPVGNPFPDHSLPPDTFLLCSVGRQVERKGLAWFVDQVMPLLPDDVHYWLAGEGPQGDSIRAASRRRGLADRVRLMGKLTDGDVERLYRAGSMFVMPNIPVAGTLEGFGVVMLEAGLHGLPSVASRLEGIKDVITEGINGHLVESGDAQGFARSIMHYYHNRQLLKALSKRAAAHTRRFGWNVIGNRYVDVLQSVAGSVPRS